MAVFRQSKRRTALFLESLLGQPCCPALTVKHQKLATDALRPAYDEIVGQLPTQTRLGIDESPTKQASEKAWLWTFVAGTFTLFAVRTSRAAVILGELLTENFRGIAAIPGGPGKPCKIESFRSVFRKHWRRSGGSGDVNSTGGTGENAWMHLNRRRRARRVRGIDCSDWSVVLSIGSWIIGPPARFA